MTWHHPRLGCSPRSAADRSFCTPHRLPVHVHRLIVELSAEHSARTVQYALYVLRIALNRAVRWGLVARNVAALVDAPRVPRRQVPVLTREQAQQFIEAVREDRLGALYTVALSLGLRQGETLGLRWAEVDLDGRTLTVGAALQRVPGRGLVLVEPKTKTSRRKIPLPRVCVAALREHRVRQLQERLLAGSLWVETGLVFTTMVGTGLESGKVTSTCSASCLVTIYLAFGSMTSGTAQQACCSRRESRRGWSWRFSGIHESA